MNFSKKNHEHKKNNRYVVSKKLLTILVTLLITFSTFAQQGFNYKAVVKDENGNILANQTMKVRFDIQEPDGSHVYIEVHEVTSNNNGIIFLNIGEGTPGQFNDFNEIDWGADNYQLQVGIDLELDGSYVNFDATEIKTVPYAKYAEKAALADNVIIENLTIGIDDLIDGKSDTNSTSLFLGENAGLFDDESDNHNIGIGANALNSNTSGSINVAIGSSSLRNNTTGAGNTASGYYALGDNSTASSNSAFGFFALRYNTTGFGNVAMGSAALLSNNVGEKNTAIGTNALGFNTEGNQNSAIGYEALASNTAGIQNTATGSEALKNNTVGFANTATGFSALRYNTSGYFNTAIGYNSLIYSTGDSNTAVGSQALSNNTDGDGNTAMGSDALLQNYEGSTNTAIGSGALDRSFSGNGNTAVGSGALNTTRRGNYNTAIGKSALSNLTNNGLNIYPSNNIGIGYEAEVPFNTSSNQVRIGNTAITYAGIQVGWTVTSDKRWKDNIRELPYGLDMVMQLQPVDYTRKNNENKTREMGFIAQDLETLLVEVGYTDQGFLTKDDDGYLSVRYNDLIALLTKAIQEQQAIIETQNSKIEAFATETAHQNATIESLILRVNAMEIANN